MSDFKELWDSVPEASKKSGGGNYDPLPEGNYIAELADCQLDLTKSPVEIKLVYQVASGDFKARKLFVNYRMDGKSLGFLKKDLTSLGVDYKSVEKVEDLANLIWEKLQTKVELYVNQREYKGKTYNNAYLNGVIAKGEEPKDDSFDWF
jgi:sporulation protein YlmC with PRC-barrel domain